MNRYQILKIRNHRDWTEPAAEWFCQKWQIPKKTYAESLRQCMEKKMSVPQWYIVTEKKAIVAGCGVIENDFHDRKDLTPNVCSVYVEEKYRNKRIAGNLLLFVCEDMQQMGIDTLYLLTDHTGFYERYGWDFLCPVQGTGETKPSRMYIHRQKNQNGSIPFFRLC